MAASTSQLFMVILFCGGCLLLQPCRADHCTLQEVKDCTNTLMPYGLATLAPILYCPQKELDCLEDLDACTDITKIIDVFRYLCNNQTGVLDTLAVNACFLDGVKEHNYTEDHLICLSESGWMDTLTGQKRCTAAKMVSTCARISAESLCLFDRSATFYDKTEDLFKYYGCFGVPEGKGSIMMPNLGMMVGILGLTLMTLLFK